MPLLLRHVNKLAYSPYIGSSSSFSTFQCRCCTRGAVTGLPPNRPREARVNTTSRFSETSVKAAGHVGTQTFKDCFKPPFLQLSVSLHRLHEVLPSIQIRLVVEQMKRITLQKPAHQFFHATTIYFIFHLWSVLLQ